MLNLYLDSHINYPMDRNIAGQMHQSLTPGSLQKKLQQHEINASTCITRQDIFKNTLYKTTTSLCAQTAAHTQHISNTIDFFFGNMSMDPFATSMNFHRTSGIIGRISYQYAAFQWISNKLYSCFWLATGIAISNVIGAWLGGRQGIRIENECHMFCALLSIPIHFIVSQTSSLTGFLTKSLLFAPACMVGVVLGSYRGIVAASYWQPDQYVLTPKIRNLTDFARLEPVESIPQERLFVTDDHYAFDVADLITLFQKSPNCVNPYTRRPLSPTSQAQLLRHPSGLGRNLIIKDPEREAAAKRLPRDLLIKIALLCEQTHLHSDPALKEVAIVKFLEDLENLPQNVYADFTRAFTSNCGETFLNWQFALNDRFGAKMNRLFLSKYRPADDTSYELLNMMSCTNGFSSYLSRCLNFVLKVQLQERQHA